MSGKVALITGITGQDGSYLTEFLLAKGYTVRSAMVEAVLTTCRSRVGAICIVLTEGGGREDARR